MGRGGSGIIQIWFPSSYRSYITNQICSWNYLSFKIIKSWKCSNAYDNSHGRTKIDSNRSPEWLGWPKNSIFPLHSKKICVKLNWNWPISSISKKKLVDSGQADGGQQAIRIAYSTFSVQLSWNFFDLHVHMVPDYLKSKYIYKTEYITCCLEVTWLSYENKAFAYTSAVYIYGENSFFQWKSALHTTNTCTSVLQFMFHILV